VRTFNYDANYNPLSVTDSLGTLMSTTFNANGTLAAGTITDTYNYDAFGNLITSTGSTPNNYLYRGEQWDSDLSLYYLRARYYNPMTGLRIPVMSIRVPE